MKGTPEFPQCGFSRATIQILGQQGVDPEKFAAYNVLEDSELREGIKNIVHGQQFLNYMLMENLLVVVILSLVWPKMENWQNY